MEDCNLIDIDAVIAAERDLIRPLTRLRPIGVVKG